jgi:transmembrane sensor
MRTCIEDDPRISEEAAEWLVKLDDNPGPECQEAWVGWVARSKRHLEEFLMVEAAAGAIKQFATRYPLPPPVPSASASDDRGANIPPPRPDRGAEPDSRPEHRRLWIAACVAALFVSVFCAFLLHRTLLPPRTTAAPVIYATGIGERSTVTLAGGTLVQMNTSSRARVDNGGPVRELNLLAGEALLRIPNESKHPFRVVTGGTAIQGAGTEFSVYHNGSMSTVSVMEGTITLLNALPQGSASAASSPPITLKAGERAVIDDDGDPRIVSRRSLSTMELQHALAWTNGVIELDGETLSEAVADFNRYNRHKLVIADPRIGQLRMGGTFRTSDLQSFTQALELAFGVHAQASANSTQLNVTQLGLGKSP